MKPPPNRALAALAGLLCAALPLRAATYYVATTGSDSAPGTESQPWRTVQKAANTLAPGDTALVRGGVYSEAVTVNVSGAPGQPVTLAAYPGETPVLDGTGLAIPQNADAGLFLIVNRSHIVIRGFDLRNYKSADPARIPAGVFVRGASSNVEIRDCRIHGIWKTGGTTGNPGSAFAIAVYGSSTTPSSGVVIDNNDIHDCKTGWSETVTLNGNVREFAVTRNRIRDCNNIGIDFIGFEGTCPDAAQDQARDGVCRGNEVWNITSEGNPAYASGDYSAGGIYADGGTRILIERNISHDNDIGIELASEIAGRTSSAITLRDNLVYRNRQTGLYLGGYAATGTGGTEGCAIEGNTFWNNDTLNWGNGEIQLRYRTSNCTFRHNILFTGASNWLVTVPVAASHNVNNTFDRNLYYSAAGASSARWKWNNTTRTGFAVWKSASGQDANSLFADPRFRSTGAAPDLHIKPDSPAVDAGDPAYNPPDGRRDFEGGRRRTGPRVDIGADELSPLAAWRLRHFGPDESSPAAADLADPDADGARNLLEYAFDTLPNDPASRPVTRAGVSGGRATLSFTPQETDGLRFFAQAGGDLADWSDQADLTDQLAAGQAFTFTDTADLAATPRRFLRLRVEPAP